MAYKDFDGLSGSPLSENTGSTLQVDGPHVDLPDTSYVRDASMERDGMDLVLDGPQGTLTIEGYFSAADTPDLVAPDGMVLSPELVNSFARSPSVYAQSHTMTDESPVGAVNEVSGEATITRLDGSVEPISLGTPVYQGDVIETGAEGAVNVAFIDETSFAVSEEARLAIDEYVFDPATESGAQNFSVLKGVFVFTSGLIGRDDPDDVNIDTPSGSIGIRGTIIAGNVDEGEITVIEGAIVVRDLSGNEMTLANQFETAKFGANGGEIQNLGQLPANEVSSRFSNVSNVSPTLFSSINDAVAEQGGANAPASDADAPVDGPQNAPRENFDADGSVDQNSDGDVDGTIGEDAGHEGRGPRGENAGEDNPDADGSIDDAAGDETTGEDAADAPADGPKPGPMQNGMGTDPMGTGQNGMAGMQGTNGMGTGPGNGMGMGGNMAAGMNGEGPRGMGMNQSQEDMMGDHGEGPNDPFNGPDDPNYHDDSSGGTGSGANPFDANTPFLHGEGAPDAFFKASDNQSWEYLFDKAFYDFDEPFGDDLTFDLSINTRSALEGAFPGEWTFDPNHGHLNITNTGSIGTNFTLDIEVVATDMAGNSAFHTFELDLEAGTVINNGPPLETSSGTYHNSTGLNLTIADSTNSMDVSGNELYLSNQNDVITLGNGASETATDNYVNLGGASTYNQVTINGDSTQNTIVGGINKDVVNLNDVKNTVYGMGGDDEIKINVNNANKTNLNDGHSDIKIDGGHDYSRYADLLKGLTPSAPAMNLGRGDTLRLEGPEDFSLDFSNLDDTSIRNIERLDIENTTNDSIILKMQDVMDMTDHNNILVIRANAGDNVTLNGLTLMAQDQKFDDNPGYTTTTSDDTEFDIYEAVNGNGNLVTVLVDTNAVTTVI